MFHVEQIEGGPEILRGRFFRTKLERLTRVAGREFTS